MGKGSNRRQGANDVAYRENYERTFGRKSWPLGLIDMTTADTIFVGTLKELHDLNERDTPNRSEE